VEQKNSNKLNGLVYIGQVSASAAFNDIVTPNPLMETLKRQATILALRVPVLLYGETGNGKELFATAIHNASPRKDRAFVPVNCGAIPQELIDSVFFGHVKGAFSNDADSLKYSLIKPLKKLGGVFNSISLKAFSGAFQCQPIQ
jgi:transcriptional regulator with PAS, ATPase and Fis domain